MKKIIRFISYIGILVIVLPVHGLSETYVDRVFDVRGLFGASTDNHIWSSAEKSLSYIDKKTEMIEQIVLPDQKRTIQCIQGIGDQLFVGTNDGIYIYQELKDAWRGPLYRGNPIYQMDFDGNRLWMIAGSHIVSCSTKIKNITVHALADAKNILNLKTLYAYQDEIWIGTYDQLYFSYGANRFFYPLEINAQDQDFRVIAVAGKYTAVGTGKGKLIVRDKLSGEESIFSCLDPDGNERFITTLIIDGHYLWVGTFDGLIIIDIKTGDQLIIPELYNKPVMIEYIENQQTSILVGTDENLYRINRPYASVRMYPQQTGYFLKTPVIESVLLFQGIDAHEDLNFEYRLASFPNIWQPAEVTVSEQGTAQKTIAWHTGAVPSWNESYELRVSIPEKKADVTLGDSVVYTMDIITPQVSFDPMVGLETLEPGAAIITGRYNKRYIESVTINPFNITAQLDRENRRFKAVIIVKQGKNKITAVIRDCTGKKAYADRDIFIGVPHE
ncbi:MAG: hypothetical protein ABII23_05060 [bacterium]